MQRSRSQVLTVVLAAALMLAVVPPAAVAQGSDDPCGDIVTTSQLKSMLSSNDTVSATGMTVVRGETPQQFEVEILGVLENGVGAGRDMIMVDVTADFIDDAGGIWQGMSGSPVYIDGDLVGAVAYGLSFVSTSIGGLTPAEDMIRLIDLPDGEPSFASASADDRPEEIVVTGPMATEIQSRVGGSTFASQSDSVRFRQLGTPMSVSGLSSTRLDVFQRVMRSRGHEVTAYAGASAEYAQASSTTTTVPEPGGNLAVASSYGDVTAAGVGTTTLACEGKVVGFGHPFQFRGEIVAGASVADSITIVPDPGFAPFKLANVGAIFGTIDQDRMAGVRGRAGDIPDRARVTAAVSDLDGRSRTGRTDIVDPQMLPDLAAFSLLANLDSTLDRLGKGSSTVGMTVRGTGSESGRFTMERTNLFASEFDISFESIFESLFLLYQLRDFAGEDVTIDSVRYDADTQNDVLAYRFDEVRIGINGEEPLAFQPYISELTLAPGTDIVIEVDLAGVDDDVSMTQTLSLSIPEDLSGFGFLQLTGGGGQGGFGGEECLFFPEQCADGESDPQTIQQLADQLASQPTNNTLTASVLIDPFTEFVDEGVVEPGVQEGSEGGEFTQDESTTESSVLLDRVISDGFGVPVFVDPGQAPADPFIDRVAGDTRVQTAAELASYTFGQTDTVVIAPAGDYPYALVAGPLAAQNFAPVLLNGEGGLDPANVAAIGSLGASRAIVVASDDMLAIDEDLAGIGITDVTRFDGADRYAVAESVAAEMVSLGSSSAWLVEGENADPARGWPDALAAAPVAAQEFAPILLTPAGQLPPTTQSAIADLGFAQVTIAGGIGAVSSEVEAAVADITNVARVAGSSRYQTSVLLAERAIEHGAFPLNMWVATGRDYPDGLAAASAVAVTGGILVLVPTGDLNNAPDVATFLSQFGGQGAYVTLLGGESAISSNVEQQLFDVLSTGAVG